MAEARVRQCPDCGSGETQLVQRGLTGPTDEADQYYRCRKCGRVTYEIISRRTRELRARRIAPGRHLRQAGKLYEVRRVLKVGVDEYLVYVNPITESEEREPPASRS